jgi:hypothetical protein
MTFFFASLVIFDMLPTVAVLQKANEAKEGREYSCKQTCKYVLFSQFFCLLLLPFAFAFCFCLLLLPFAQAKGKSKSPVWGAQAQAKAQVPKGASKRSKKCNKKLKKII